MSISVIVAALNAASTIRAQLDALAAQDYPAPFEILVCDNGSTDGTRDIVQRIAQADARFRLIDASQTRGAGPARNVGVGQARYELVAFCDADDIADSGWLSAIAAALDTHDVVAGRVETVSLNPEWTRIARPLPEGIQRGSFLPFAGAGNLAFRRCAFQRVGGFDPEVVWLEDVDLSWRLQLAGHSIGFAPDAVMHVRLRQSISGIYAQGLHYGLALAQLEQRYRELMGAAADVAAAASGPTTNKWGTIGNALSLLARHPGRGGWGFVLWQLGWHVGHHSAQELLAGSNNATSSRELNAGVSAARHA